MEQIICLCEFFSTGVLLLCVMRTVTQTNIVVTNRLKLDAINLRYYEIKKGDKILAMFQSEY